MPEDETPPPVSRRSWFSLAAVLLVQTQNAFNDNFVKFVLIGLGFAVAQGMIVFGVDLGAKIQFILGALIPVPFILAAPIAGWFSDRFSKKHVIVASLLLQIAIFVMIWLAIVQRQVMPAIFGYFLLAVQSTIFSPAKQGILKEIVGSSRLALANGLMQMLTMIGILGGAGLGGWWFDKLLSNLNEENGVILDNAWKAANWPVVFIGLACLAPLLISALIERTPSHPEKRFEAAVFFRHFKHLGRLLKNSDLRGIALKIGLYWFVANFMALVLIAFGKELFPDSQEGGAASASSMMLVFVGVGLFIGSSLVAVFSRDRIQLKLIPLGAAGMTLGFLGMTSFEPAGGAFRFATGFVGFASGFFIVPLTAWLQDLAPEDERGRIISASNLINAFTGIVAIVICNGLDSAGLSASGQTILLLALMGSGFVWTFSYLRKSPDSRPPGNVPE